MTPVMRRLIATGSSDELDDVRRITYQHTVLAQLALPYRSQQERIWKRANGAVRLAVTAGAAYDQKLDDWVDVPLPHGTKPRLILLHLNAEALRTGNPTIELGHSLTGFVKRMLGYSPNGRELARFWDQATALATAHVLLSVRVRDAQTGRDYQQQVKGEVIESMDLWQAGHPDQRVIWPSFIKLSDRYFQSLTAHAIPLSEAAVRALAHSAVALDCYAWLAQRLHRIPRGKSQFIDWVSLHEQFGAQYRRVRDFRRFFLRQLAAVHAVYPEAKFDINDRRGLTVHNSPPPVKPRLITEARDLFPPDAPDDPFQKTLRAIGRALSDN